MFASIHSSGPIQKVKSSKILLKTAGLEIKPLDINKHVILKWRLFSSSASEEEVASY